MAAYAFAIAEEEDTLEPLTYQEAVACEDSSKWKAAMEDEMDSLRKNKTWELVDHPARQKLVSCKWLFKIKEGIECVQSPRYKARLVARGFTQRADYELEQLDVKTTFLHGNLEEVIYMRQPSGYEQGNKVCLLKKSLYGLKQLPRQWYRRFDEYMLSNGFKHSSYDSCVYYKSYAPGEYIYLLLYVDDMLIASKSKVEIRSTKTLLKREFDMKELEEAKKILGIEIIRDWSRKILRVSQSEYVSKILNNFRIDNGKSVQMPLGGHFKLSLKDYPVRDCDVERMSKVSYENVVGSLMYLMVCTRPDIAYAVSIVSRYLANPDVTSFVDSDYAKDPDKGRSITGYAILVQGCVVSSKATLQYVVALSTRKAEYMALTEAVKESIWLRGLLRETKHINLRYHFIREVLEAKTVNVLKVGTEHNAADALMNVVPGHKLQHCLEFLSVVVSIGYGIVRPTLGGVTSKVLILGVVYFVASEALELVENLGNINDFYGKTKLYLVLPIAFLDSREASVMVYCFKMRRSIAKLEVYRKFINALALFVLLSIAWIGYELYFNATDPISELWRIDSSDSIHLYSNPNTDPDRTPLTKAKGQIPQWIKYTDMNQ
ncbi:retrovirus-related pol polyprotein from transposon TNT 1-94 [Tanacetum coccineum]